ncbi:serine O-acetyltransferase [Priestia megaterium]|uniref:Serine acetyltransferase n=1 Tax=Priestia megaterium (strain DSM 319 / IMG 1521) TaxID=592022 RepID=D5DBJ0_PRIM3|nr:serine acetyltransferase [Priestia megaterium]ADF37972.1 serine acetyltransferase (SAT) [Priestia megaterium DSM 319]MED4217272.1 serine acetyltransferase [Priestia megaterium]WEZ37219.1 serine acetyltransferase [Priestia megaterium DSM 319]
MIKDKKDYYYYLQEDMKAHNVSKWNIRMNYQNPTLRFQRLLRKLEYYKNCRKDFIGKIYFLILKFPFHRQSIDLGFTIPMNVFGPGLSIAHYGSIVINTNVKVGKNCRIHSATNIGEGKGKTPILGDNIYIAPGVKIFGGITIGNNVSIGANAVVNKSFPDNVVIAGIPAKIISHKENANETIL